MAAMVRRAQGDRDFRLLHRIFVDYEAALPRDLRHGSVPEITELRDTFVGRNAAFLAIRDGDAIGCVGVTALDAESALLLRLFVAPQSRGLGAARALVLAAIAFAREAGYRRIVLDTEKARLNAAYALYRSLGFAECEPWGAVTYAPPTFMELFLD